MKVGVYTDIMFPEKGVRLIAVNNGVDSETMSDNDFTPFLNIMNEWYAKDKQHLSIDPEPAEVVRRIFRLVIEGVNVSAIARTLTREQVLIPSAYAAEHCPENDHSKGYTNPYTWSTTAICYILEKQEYMGIPFWERPSLTASRPRKGARHARFCRPFRPLELR